MAQTTRPIELSTFLTSLRDRTAHGVSTIALDGGQLPVSVHLQDSPAVVFTFSGAVDRTRYQLPRFTSTSLHEQVPASVIALADPSLPQSDELTLAWYAGHQGFELQKILPDLLRQIIDSLGATRAAFVGSSGGGFAALYYSGHIPGSIAVVSNPQTNLDHYIRAHRRRYITACWPPLDKDTPLNSVVDADLCALYAKGTENTVIYLQTDGDFFHLRWHFGPFVSTLPREFAPQLLVRMSNWGSRGHHPVPATIWIPWMNAALSAEDTTAASIEATWAEAHAIQPPLLEASTHPATRESQITRTVWSNEQSRQSPQPAPASRDAEIASELARLAATALLSQQPSESGSL